MIELVTTEFASVIPLLAGIKQKVLPKAIYQGYSPGRIFVDARENPQLALIWSAVGYYFLVGDPTQSHDFVDVSRVLTELFVPDSQARGESGFILVPSRGSWEEHLPSLLPEREVIEIFRRPFQFDAVQFAALGNWRDRIPPGFQIQIVDALLAERIGILASWCSMDAFLASGLGYALLHGNEIACACTSVFASHDQMEVDIHTEEKYQRRGFAKLIASVFIEECLRRGKQPNWECFWENEPSIALAQKLGFNAEPDYPVFFWEE